MAGLRTTAMGVAVATIALPLISTTGIAATAAAPMITCEIDDVTTWDPPSQSQQHLLSADGSTLLSRTSDDLLQVRDLDTSTTVELPGTEEHSPKAISPDGQRAIVGAPAATAPSGHAVVDLTTGAITPILPPAADDGLGPSPVGFIGFDFATDSLYGLVASSSDGAIALVHVDADTGARTVRATDVPTMERQLSADGSTVLLIGTAAPWPSTELVGALYDTTTGAATPLPADVVGPALVDGLWGITGSLQHPRLGLDGSVVIFSSTEDLDGSNDDGSREVWQYETATNDTTSVTAEGPDQDSYGALPTPDGTGVVHELRADAGGSHLVLSALPAGPAELLTSYLYSGPDVVTTDADGSRTVLVDPTDRAVVFDRVGPTSTWLEGNDRPSFQVGGDGAIALTASGDLDGSNPELLARLWTGVPLAAVDTGPAGGGVSSGASIDAAGRRIAFVSSQDPTGGNPEHNREVFIADADGTDATQITSTVTGDAATAHISPDGTAVVFRSNADLDGLNPDGRAVLYQWREGEQLVAVAGPDVRGVMSATRLASSSDGRWVTFAGSLDLADVGGFIPTGIYRWDRAAGQVERLAGPASPTQAYSVDMAHDGTIVVTAGTDVAVYPPGEDDPLRHPVPDPRTVAGVTADGRYAFLGSGASGDGGRTQRIDLETGAVVEVTLPGADLTGAKHGVEAGSTPRFLSTWSSRGVATYRCAVFVDVRPDHPFSEMIDSLANAGVVGGFPDQTFRPSASVTRQAMAAFLYRLAGADEPTPATDPFDDVSTTHPFATEIAWASNEGITTGFDDGTFRPAAIVTRQAAAAFLHRLIDPTYDPPDTATFTDVSTSHPFFAEIEWAADEQITTGYPDHTFRPGAVVTRQAAAAFLHRTEPLL